MSAVETVEVDLDERRYVIRVGAGLLGRAGTELADLITGRKTVVVVDEAVATLHLASLMDALAGTAAAVHPSRSRPAKPPSRWKAWVTCWTGCWRSASTGEPSWWRSAAA